MRSRKSLSEAAKWFLEDFQKTLNDFANDLGFQVLVVDKEGNLVNETNGIQKACKAILATEDGRIRCNDHFKASVSLVEGQEKPIFSECYAGFSFVRVPIIIRESLIGVIIICGGRYDKGESKEKIKEKFSKLANEIGIIYKENFLTTVLEEVPIVTKEEIKEIIKKLKKLFDIFSTTTFTPLKEVFG